MKHCHACNREVNDHVRFCPFCGSGISKVECDFLSGSIFAGEFRIERTIREGDPGPLFAATQLSTGARVIISVLSQRLIIPLGLESIAPQLQAAERIVHPSIAAIREAHILNVETPFLVLENFDGLSLTEQLGHGPFELQQASLVINKIAGALDAANLKGLSPCAITPASVWLIGQGVDSTVKVTDLGISSLLASVDSQVFRDTMLDSPSFRYEAPEIINGLEGDATSDVYSLGVIAYEMIAGHTPFHELAQIEISMMSGSAKPLRDIRSEVSEELDACILKALSNDPSRRQASVLLLAREIEARLAPGPLVFCAACGGTIGLAHVFCLHCGSRTKKPSPLSFHEPIGQAIDEVDLKTISFQSPPPPMLASQTPTAPLQDEKPIYLDENVQFTVYRPRTIRPMTWSTLLAFAHLSEKRPDAAPDEPDPIAEVQKQARQVLGGQFAHFQTVSQDSAQAVPREGEITFLPVVPGIEFNPPSRTFLWEEDVHKEEFRLRASSGLDHQVARGRLSVFLGSILLAEVTLSIRVDSTAAVDSALESAAAQVYRKIFASYSHKDSGIVDQFEHYAKAFGDRYLRDVNDLRAGEVWNDRLGEMIQEANVFQLFWSSNSMKSEFVRQEWQYALGLRRSNFVRPTYWEVPLPTVPEEKLPPEELVRLHFQLIAPSFSEKPKVKEMGDTSWLDVPMPAMPSRPPDSSPPLVKTDFEMERLSPRTPFSVQPPNAGWQSATPPMGGARLSVTGDLGASGQRGYAASPPVSPQASGPVRSSQLTIIFGALGCLVLAAIILVALLFFLRMF